MSKNKHKEEKAKVIAPAPKADATKAAAEKPKAETPKVEAPKRPDMPANFCMEKADWEGNGVCYDPKSNGCKACAKDKEFAETIAVCKARAEFLATFTKAAKPKGERKARTGGTSQTDVINKGIAEKKSMTEIAKEVAAAAYSGDEKTAKQRISRHIKSILNGSCKNAAALQPMVAYLVEKKAA